jgi:hypothetical protein
VDYVVPRQDWYRVQLAGDSTMYRTGTRTYALRDSYKQDDRSQTCT